MQPIQETQVLIVGGGIGGLTLAALCRKLNISYLVLERSKKVTPAGAGISLAPNALRVLDQLGLYQDIVRQGQTLDKIHIHRNQTKWRSLDWARVTAPFGYPVYSIERHDFHHLLYRAADGENTVLLDSSVADLLDDPTERLVNVKLENGAQINANVVVGADGIRSVTRRILARQAGLDGKNTIRFTGRVHMSGYTAPMENLGPKDLGQVENQGQEEMGRSVWANTTPAMVNEAYGTKFHPFAETGQFKDIVDRSERVIASNVFEETDFPTMSKGRIALLGDAAHSMTSFFGQGACQAIEDATELANSLQQHFSVPGKGEKGLQRVPLQGGTSGLAQILSDYSTRRSQRAKAVASFSRDYAKVHTGKLPYGMGPLVRKIIYAYMPEWGWTRGLRWLYGHQPTLVDVSNHSGLAHHI
ncbi:MAG: hypothetical protein Q9182_005142 [Xanthomendoza sp. 2 TL-2023]